MLQLPMCATHLLDLQGLLTDHDQKTGPGRVLCSCKGATPVHCSCGHKFNAGAYLRAYTDICQA